MMEHKSSPVLHSDSEGRVRVRRRSCPKAASGGSNVDAADIEVERFLAGAFQKGSSLRAEIGLDDSPDGNHGDNAGASELECRRSALSACPGGEGVVHEEHPYVPYVLGHHKRPVGCLVVGCPLPPWHEQRSVLSTKEWV